MELKSRKGYSIPLKDPEGNKTSTASWANVIIMKCRGWKLWDSNRCTEGD